MLIKYLRFLLLIVIIISCVDDVHNNIELKHLLPSDTDYLLETDDLARFISGYSENKITKELSRLTSPELNSFLEQINNLKHSGKAVLGIDRNKDLGSDLYLLFKSEADLTSLDSIRNYTLETEIRGKDTLYIHSIDSTEIFQVRNVGLNFISNKKLLAQNFSFKPVESTSKSRIAKLTFEGNQLTINTDGIGNPFPVILNLNDFEAKTSITNSLDINFIFNENTIEYNGITTVDESDGTFLSLLRNTIPQENKFSLITPLDVNTAISFTFDDAEKFYANIESYLVNDSLPAQQRFQNATEFAMVFKDDATAFLVHSLNMEDSMDEITDKSLLESYKEFDIYENMYFAEIPNFYNALQLNSYRYLVAVENFMVMSNSLEFIKNIISSYTNENTLANSDTYLSYMQKMSDESSLFMYYNRKAFNNALSDKYDSNINLKLDANFKNISQYIVEKDFAHVNILLGSHNGSTKRKFISENLNYKLDAAILSEPQFVENHLSKSLDIAVQDVNNMLYLIDNNGKLLFKRQLDGNILGNIAQIDSFKNGRKQLVLSTENTVYIIARNGKDVSNFPKKFRDKITQPISVFDYDNRRNYRLLVTQGNELLMIDKDGKRVNGFKYSKKPGNISTQPKHFRFGGKDYIVYAQQNSLKVLSRTGKERVSVSDKFDFSNNAIFPYQDKFTFVDESGNLVQVDARGRVERNPFYQPMNPRIASTSKTLVSLDENRLKIRAKTLELDFGLYSDPKVFYLNNKIYVSVTDLQTNKVFLYDSQAQLIPGFPVYGSSSIDIGNFDTDNALEILTKDGENGILVYELN